MKSVLVGYWSRLKISCSLYISIGVLLIKYLFKRKDLKILKLCTIDSILIDGIRSYLVWEVDGCWMIKFDGKKIIAGNSAYYEFYPDKKTESIKITFYGVTKRVNRVVHTHVWEVGLLYNFQVQGNIDKPKILMQHLKLNIQFNSPTKPIGYDSIIPQVFDATVLLPTLDIKFEQFHT